MTRLATAAADLRAPSTAPTVTVVRGPMVRPGSNTAKLLELGQRSDGVTVAEMLALGLRDPQTQLRDNAKRFGLHVKIARALPKESTRYWLSSEPFGAEQPAPAAAPEQEAPAATAEPEVVDAPDAPPAPETPKRRRGKRAA